MFSKYQTKPYLGKETKSRKKGVYVVAGTQYSNGFYGKRSFFICKNRKEADKICQWMKRQSEVEWREVWIDKYFGDKVKLKELTSSHKKSLADPHNLVDYS